MERYEIVKDLGSGNFGVAKLVRDKWTKEFFAVKFIERGQKIDEHVRREIINHSSLKHPNIIRFKEVLPTPTHLAIVMEYAAGGELFERICKAGKFIENESIQFPVCTKTYNVACYISLERWGKDIGLNVFCSLIIRAPVSEASSSSDIAKRAIVLPVLNSARFFFQQLISGVSYCHSLQICHRDLKLENTLLDGSPAPRVKICDFGYSKSSLWHSQPKSAVGTPAYIAPEVFSKREYDGKIADVWSCGVTLYVMLFGAYPFEDPADPRNFRKSICRILGGQYSIPNHIPITIECRHLLSCIFVVNPEMRITMLEIKNHPWYLKNLPVELMEGGSWQSNDINQPSQSHEEILSIIQEASMPTEVPGNGPFDGGSMDLDDLETDADIEDLETSADFVSHL